MLPLLVMLIPLLPLFACACLQMVSAWMAAAGRSTGPAMRTSRCKRGRLKGSPWEGGGGDGRVFVACVWGGGEFTGLVVCWVGALGGHERRVESASHEDSKM